MRCGHAVLGLMLVTVSLVGCLGDTGMDDDGSPSPGEDIDHDALAAAIGEPIEMDHDHTDPTLHTDRHNVDVVAWDTLDVDLGENGFADFVFHEDDGEELVFVAIDGDERGGFKIVDVSDPQDMQVLGSYMIPGNGIQEVQVTPDGRFALMNVQAIPSPDPTATDCQVCIHIVDVTDRTQPERAGLYPVEVIGTHNIQIEVIDGATYVFYTGQPLYTSNPVGPGSNPPPGQEVGIARLETTPQGDAQLVKVSEYRHADDYTTGDRSFPHDIFVDTHPITGQLIMWAAWWDGGAITVDVTNPLAPMELDVHNDPAPSQALNTHEFRPEPEPRGETLYAWSAPEIGELDSGSGVIRAYDATDPAAFEQIATWALPGDVTIPEAFLMSPHTVDVDPATQLAVVAHYHAGIWVLDASDPTDPQHVGFIQPVGDPEDPYTGEFWWKKPNFDPEGYLPNVFRATWHDGQIWATERGTGLYVLDYTGPLPAGAS